MDSKKIQGMLTLNVEDWDHAHFSHLRIRGGQIAATVRERRYAMDTNVDLWVDILAEFNAKSTCFILGEFASRFPEAVKRLSQAGHEIASHGPSHKLIYELSQKQFREFLKRGLGDLGNLIGKTPRGFRAPNWSVDESVPWFCEELKAQNVIYDSSLFPLKVPFLGRSKVSIQPYWDGGVFRIPMTALRFGFVHMPCSGKAFFRMVPLEIIRFGLRRASAQNIPIMLAIHPRELDPIHPRLPLKNWEEKIHYANLHETLPKLKTLLKEMSWTTIEENYKNELSK